MIPFDWRYLISRLLLLTIGALAAAFSVVIFLAPSDIAPGGMTGISVILNELFGTPIGVMFIVGNIPIQILAYRMLSGWRVIGATIYAMLLYAVALDVLPSVLTIGGVSDDVLLNALFGGILSGIGSGLIYRAGGTLGGASSLARILRRRYGMSLSTSSLYTDLLVLIAAGLVFSWEAALYTAIVIFVGRSTSDYVLDGGSSTSTAIVISDRSAEIVTAVTDMLEHGITSWRATGRYSDQPYEVLLITVTRSELNALRKLIMLIDPQAFVTILMGQETYGRGFKSLEPRLPLALDQIEDDASTAIDSEKVTRMVMD